MPSYAAALVALALYSVDLPALCWEHRLSRAQYGPTAVAPLGPANRPDAAAASLGLAEAALGLQAWNATHGAYPARLDQLRSGMRWPVPLDPFSRQEYVYRAQGEQYVLYRVGVNLKDDGGSGGRDEQQWPEDILWGQ